MLKQIFKQALTEGYALGAFNFDSLDVLKAIVNAAEAQQKYCLACVSEGALKSLGDEYLCSLMAATRKKTDKVFFHLDHGKSFEICQKAIALGFDSVMIDGSSLPFEENIALTKQVVDFAHSKNVLVEGEIGVLAGVEEDISSSKNIYTNPDEALKFVQLTNVDTLAVAIGTSHGAHKFKGEAKLDIDILSKIEQLLPNTPLVLHGASSVYQESVEILNQFGGSLRGGKGVPDKILGEVCTQHNICKVNTDTDLRITFIGAMRQYLTQNPEQISVRNILNYAQSCTQKAVEHKMQVLSK